MKGKHTPRRSLAPGTVRNLAMISGIYRAVLKDSLALIEAAEVENGAVMIAQDRLIAALKRRTRSVLRAILPSAPKR